MRHRSTFRAGPSRRGRLRPPGPRWPDSRARTCATEPVRTVPFFNLYDDIQITQLGSTGLATTLGAAGIPQVPAFSRACRGRRPRRGTQHDPGAPRRHRRGDRVSPGVIHVTAPRRRSGAGSRGGEGLVAPTTRSSRRHTPGQVTPNDTKRHFRAPFWPIFAVFRARDCAMQPVRTVPNHLSDQSRSASVEGLPPAYICVGQLDLFRDESISCPRRGIRNRSRTPRRYACSAPLRG